MCVNETSFGPRERSVLYASRSSKTIFRHRDEIQFDAAFRLKHMPGNEIGVMFHLGQDHKVALPSDLRAPTNRQPG